MLGSNAVNSVYSDQTTHKQEARPGFALSSIQLSMLFKVPHLNAKETGTEMKGMRINVSKHTKLW